MDEGFIMRLKLGTLLTRIFPFLSYITPLRGCIKTSLVLFSNDAIS